MGEENIKNYTLILKLYTNDINYKNVYCTNAFTTKYRYVSIQHKYSKSKIFIKQILTGNEYTCS